MTNSDNAKQVPYTFAKQHGILIRRYDLNSGAEVICLNTTPFAIICEVQRFLQCPMQVKKMHPDEFQNYLAQIFQAQSSLLDATQGMEDSLDLNHLAGQLPNSEDLLDSQDDAPIIRLINALFNQAIQKKASDIHVETYEQGVLVRYRVDGVLQEVLEIQRSIAPLVISRIKVMAKLDIAEKRIPQDGRIALRIGDHTIDVRVSTLPSNHGERIVLRILDKKTAQLNLSLLGMQKDTLAHIQSLILQPHGILLVTGPTGSGKTTSLYAMLSTLNEVTRNILTIEDPIEYDLPGIGQTQVNPKVHMTFAKGLRAILRQDPDVVMVGEIRDLETAEIAIQASLTGHLVLSTLHTNSALGALTRLHDMGVESFLLSSSVIGLMSQRLVRTLCPDCKVAYKISPEEQQLLTKFCQHYKKGTKIYKAFGCEHCNHTGFRGRVGIYELILIDETIRSMIHRNENLQTIENYIRPTCRSMREDGFLRVLSGETAISEILRVTS